MVSKTHTGQKKIAILYCLSFLEYFLKKPDVYFWKEKHNIFTLIQSRSSSEKCPKYMLGRGSHKI